MAYDTELRLKVRLTRRLPESLNGIDLSAVHEGECVDLVPPEARLLILEGLAELVDPAPVEVPVAPPAVAVIDKAPNAEPEHEPY
jgi:hypothetical protein